MKNSGLSRGITPFLFVLLATGMIARDGFAQNPDSKTVAEIQALLKAHDEAFKQQDIAAVMAIFAQGANTVVLGTGPGERWQGKPEIESAYKEMFKDFDKGNHSSNCYWRTGGVNGNMAWLATMCKISDSLTGKPREYELNVTAVAEKVGSKWLFRSVHFSNLTGESR